MVLSAYQHAARWELYLFNTLSVILIFRTDLIICSCFFRKQRTKEYNKKKTKPLYGKDKVRDKYKYAM